MEQITPADDEVFGETTQIQADFLTKTAPEERRLARLLFEAQTGSPPSNAAQFINAVVAYRAFWKPKEKKEAS